MCEYTFRTNPVRGTGDSSSPGSFRLRILRTGRENTPRATKWKRTHG